MLAYDGKDGAGSWNFNYTPIEIYATSEARQVRIDRLIEEHAMLDESQQLEYEKQDLEVLETGDSQTYSRHDIPFGSNYLIIKEQDYER